MTVDEERELYFEEEYREWLAARGSNPPEAPHDHTATVRQDGTAEWSFPAYPTGSREPD